MATEILILLAFFLGCFWFHFYHAISRLEEQIQKLKPQKSETLELSDFLIELLRSQGEILKKLTVLKEKVTSIRHQTEKNTMRNLQIYTLLIHILRLFAGNSPFLPKYIKDLPLPIKGIAQEIYLFKLLTEKYPPDRFEHTGQASGSPDFIVINKNGEKILIEIKTFEVEVKDPEVLKFRKYLQKFPCIGGIFVNFGQGEIFENGKSLSGVEKYGGKKVYFLPAQRNNFDNFFQILETEFEM